MTRQRAAVSAGHDVSVLETPAPPSDTTIKIGEMAKEFGVTLRTLRFYEDKGLLGPHRDGHTRLYTRRDRARMKLILLGRRVGFSLRDVKQMIELYDPSGSNVRQLRFGLEKSEKQLGRLHKQQASTADAIAELQKLITELRTKIGDRSPSLMSVAAR